MTDQMTPPTHAPDWNEPPVPVKKQSSTLPIVIGALVLAGVVALVIGVSVYGNSRPAPTSPAVVSTPVSSTSQEAPAVYVPTGHSVVYQITGGSALSVSYSTPGFGISQAADVPLPWTKAMTFDSDSVIAVVNAQNAGGGTIGCAILIDGMLVAHNTSTGEYAIVQCTGSNH